MKSFSSIASSSSHRGADAEDPSYLHDDPKETHKGNAEEQFVWHKKRKRDKKLKSEHQVDQEHVKMELDLLKRRRLEREEDRRLRDEERIQAQREADRAQFGDWETREDSFQLKQLQKRVELRIQENRPHPIDLFALPLLLLQSPEFPAHFAIRDPVAYLESLPHYDLERVRTDMELFLLLDLSSAHQAYWKCLTELCHAQMTKAKRMAESRVAASVHQEIHDLLKGQTLAQLQKLEATIARKLASREPIDTDYWEEMLAAVKLWQSRRHIVQVYQDALKARHAYCLEHQIDETFSVSEEEPLEPPEEAPAAEDAKDEEMAKEIQLTEQKTYTWAYKYRPRKPKYVNRVNTGYEWNKYNQTHYDMDNPPPKVVQGYKFNIFYPDLLDRSKAPTYRIEPKPNSPDTAIIRFTAGAPYEDIAFEIVNKEWEMSHRKGFRCVFDRGVLQLHFQFKRYFYRK